MPGQVSIFLLNFSVIALRVEGEGDLKAIPLKVNEKMLTGGLLAII